MFPLQKLFTFFIPYQVMKTPKIKVMLNRSKPFSWIKTKQNKFHHGHCCFWYFYYLLPFVSLSSSYSCLVLLVYHWFTSYFILKASFFYFLLLYISLQSSFDSPQFYFSHFRLFRLSAPCEQIVLPLPLSDVSLSVSTLSLVLERKQRSPVFGSCFQLSYKKHRKNTHK